MAETLDIEQPDQLLQYLRARGHIDASETPRFQVLSGGVSNRTVLVERAKGYSWVLKQALPKLRVQVDWFSPPERAQREALGLRWLAKLAPPGTTTPFVFEDLEFHLIAMQAVPKPHANWKSMLLDGDIRPDHVMQFAHLLGHVHRESARRRDELLPVFGDRSYFESLRLEPYYVYTATQAPESAGFYDSLVDECRRTNDTLVHGDFSPKNVLVHDDRLILLDHEVIHFGDPGFDLGFALTHLLSKAHHLPAQRTAFAQSAVDFWRIYEQTVESAAWHTGLEARAVRHTLGCLLARVRGRSPLEYLNKTDRDRQADIVTTLMRKPPPTVTNLSHQFCASLADRK